MYIPIFELYISYENYKQNHKQKNYKNILSTENNKNKKQHFFQF